MARLSMLLKEDRAFKQVMGKNPALLRSLVEAVLLLEQGSTKEFVVASPASAPEQRGAKSCRFDMALVVDERFVNLELQLVGDAAYCHRIAFDAAKVHASSVKRGQRYEDGPESVLVCLLDFDLFPCEGFYSEFCLSESFRHEVLSDRMKVVVIEMRKCEELAGDDPLGLWIRLFRATTTQELDDIERSGVPIMAEAVREMRKIQHEDIQRMVALSYELAEYDEAIMIREAEERGAELGERRGEQRAEQRLIKRMAASGLSIAQIVAASGYSEEQVAALLEA